MHDFVRKSRDGVLVDIKVVANAKKEGIKFSDGTLRVSVKAPPEKGKANKSVLSLFKDAFEDCEIVSGGASHKKTLLIKKMDVTGVLKKIDLYSLKTIE